MIGFDTTKSLQQLDGEDWGEPNFESHLVLTCQGLRRIPLKDFTVEDMRIMIGQNIGLDYLIPIALEKIRNNPFSEGAFYPGDLLVSVLRADSKFWRTHSQLRSEVVQIAERAFTQLSSLSEIEQSSASAALKEAYDIFERLA